MSTIIKDDVGNSNLAQVNAANQMEVKVANPVETDGTTHIDKVGTVRIASEVDNGEYTGTADLYSPEVDDDYRLRVAHDIQMDHERFNYTLQNTGKHTFTFTTLAATVTAAGLTTNSGSISTNNTGLTFGTFAQFPMFGNQTTVCETSVAFTAQPTSNTIVDFGLFQRGASTAFAPTDGVYFRLTSAGLQGVINSGGSETTTSIFPLSNGAGTWVYSDNTVNKYLIQTNNERTTFWINNTLAGYINTPAGTNMPSKAETQPWSIRHAIVGGAAGDNTFKAIFMDYKVTQRGALYKDDMGTINNRVLGSYQALSGATPGSLMRGTVTSGTVVLPTAAVPTNTTAALGTGMGGVFYETVTLAAGVDGIICSFQNPAASITVQGRRMKITGVSLASFVQTVIAGGPWNATYHIAFGHTAVSLATAETASMATATTKAPRRVMTPIIQTVTATQAVNTAVAQTVYSYQFLNPIYVNAGEFIALVTNHVGTVGTSGVLSHSVTFDYSWE